VLEKADRLVVVGYSFRDGHINEFIRRWLNLQLTRRLLVLDPGWPEHVGHSDFRAELQQHLFPLPFPNSRSDQNWEPRLKIVREGARAGLSAALTTATEWA